MSRHDASVYTDDMLGGPRSQDADARLQEALAYDSNRGVHLIGDGSDALSTATYAAQDATDPVRSDSARGNVRGERSHQYGHPSVVFADESIVNGGAIATAARARQAAATVSAASGIPTARGSRAGAVLRRSSRDSE